MALEHGPSEQAVENVRVASFKPLLSPIEVRRANPPTDKGLATVNAGRQAVRAALDPVSGHDKLIVVVGPCSVHDVDQSLEYTGFLREMSAVHKQELVIVQRVYFEKPRTTIGWEGLVKDPHLDETFDINFGLMAAGKLLRDTTDRGMPVATEWLDTDGPGYYGGFISWGAIGARTVESPLHRGLASGLSSAVGFKNNTDGNVQVAIDGVTYASKPRHFIGTHEEGGREIIRTDGNPECHIVLRGGKQGPNFSANHVAEAIRLLSEAKLIEKLMIDISHANSGKDFTKQRPVAENVATQIADGNKHIMGVMMESHLKEGRQDLIPGQPLKYGVSITDACMGLDETAVVLQTFADAVKIRRGHS